MKISVKGFIYHKDAESFEDCFDRYAVDIEHNKFCVSDGVSKSFFPGLWAELLVKDFVASPGKVDLIDTKLLRVAQRKWKEQVTEIVNRPNQKYYVRNFFAQGRSAAATFVGLNFYRELGKHRWEAFALGDSFLFFIPKNIQNIDSEFEQITYLSSKADFEFDNFPDFFDSTHQINKGKIKQIKHDLSPGTFFLMTDALSEWFIHEKNSAMKEIRSWGSQRFFQQRIVDLRKSNLQNDDCAILIIEIEQDNKPDLTYNWIDISNLEVLQRNEKYRNEEPNYQNEINAIGEKFLIESSIKRDTDTNQPIRPISESDSKSYHSGNAVIGKNQEYLSKRNRPKQKKRGFWEKRVDAVVKMFSARHHYEDYDQQIDDNKSNKRNDPFQDLDSITDKF